MMAVAAQAAAALRMFRRDVAGASSNGRGVPYQDQCCWRARLMRRRSSPAIGDAENDSDVQMPCSCPCGPRSMRAVERGCCGPSDRRQGRMSSSASFVRRLVRMGSMHLRRSSGPGRTWSGADGSATDARGELPFGTPTGRVARFPLCRVEPRTGSVSADRLVGKRLVASFISVKPPRTRLAFSPASVHGCEKICVPRQRRSSLGMVQVSAWSPRTALDWTRRSRPAQ
jgi:hypothetical protein